MSRAEKKKMLADNAPVLRLVREGVRLPYRQAKPQRSSEDVFPEYSQFRAMAYTLALDGSVKAEQGDWAGAADSYVDAVTMGFQIPAGGNLITRLVGIACQAIGRRGLWKHKEQLPGAAAKRAAKRLEKLTGTAHPLSETLTEERYFGQASLLEGFRGKRMEEAQDAGDEWKDTYQHLYRTMPVVVGKSTMMRDYGDYMDRLIGAAKTPYARRPPPPAPPDNLRYTYLRILHPVYEEVYLKEANSGEVQNTLLAVALALRAHKAERGAYPQTLNALIPVYLSKIPDDPFAASGLLSYKRTTSGYVLYSVGPDGADDGGKAIDRAGVSGKGRRYVDANSRGDIVVGVNIY